MKAARRPLTWLAVMAAAVACGHRPPPSPPALGEGPEQVADAFWELLLSDDPFWATAMGDRRMDAAVPDIGPQARAASAASRRELLTRLGAFNPALAGATGRLTAAVLGQALQDAIAEEACDWALWRVDPFAGVLAQVLALPWAQVVATPGDATAYLLRLGAVGGWIDQHSDNLREGLAHRQVAPAPLIRLAVAALDRAVAARLPLAPGAWRQGDMPPPAAGSWQKTFLDDLAASAEPAVRAALGRYRDLLRDELLPAAREALSLRVQVGADACYQARILQAVGSAQTPERLLDIGQAEVERLRADAGLAATDRLLAAGPDSATAVLAQLPGLADTALRRLSPALLPATWEAVQWRQAAGGAVAYSPALVVPATSQRPPQVVLGPAQAWESGAQVRVWAAAESVPGRLLQQAWARHDPRRPRLLRMGGAAALRAGWPAYARRWSLEAALWGPPAALAAAVLAAEVREAALATADVGLQVRSWSLDEAAMFLVDNADFKPAAARQAALALAAAPGCAWSPVAGRLALVALRHEAERRHGPALDLDAFHGVILAQGPVPLPLLRQQVRAWLTRPPP